MSRPRSQTELLLVDLTIMPPSAFDLFMDLSEVLTGFDQADLMATAMGQTYFNELILNAGSTATGQLLQTYAEITREFPARDERFLEAVANRIMGPFGPLAQNIVMLWYSARWNQLPGPWRAIYGASASDQDHIVSADAYVQGLVWKTMDSHPRAAKAPGFGTWALPPNVPSTIPPHG